MPHFHAHLHSSGLAYSSVCFSVNKAPRSPLIGGCSVGAVGKQAVYYSTRFFMY